MKRVYKLSTRTMRNTLLGNYCIKDEFKTNSELPRGIQDHYTAKPEMSAKAVPRSERVSLKCFHY